jgi:arylsulfatase A-like enzyme
MKLKHGHIPGMLLLLAWAGCNSEQDAATPVEHERPNIVLVMIDALRRDHLGLYGYPRPTSPFLDEIGAQGIVFDNAYSQASQTFTSTATLFTSRIFPEMVYPRQLNPDFSLYSIDATNLTLAEVLQGHGYRTFGIFTNPHHHANSGFTQGFDESVHLWYYRRGKAGRGNARGVVDAFVAWLDDPSPGPFLAYLHFMDVHDPYWPPPRYRRLFPTRRARRIHVHGRPEGDRVPTNDDLAYMKAMYDGEIRWVDEQLARMATELRRRGHWEDTVVVVTSDHGDEFMEHGGLGHGHTLEKEMIWIPLILYAGGRDLGNPRRIEGVARNIDVAPTILDLAGIRSPDGFEGRSLLAMLGEEGTDDEAHSFAWQGPHRSITDLRWHFVLDRDSQEVRLYDNRTDPAGLDDVAPSHPKVVEAYRRLAGQYEARLLEMRRTAQELEARGGAVHEVAPGVVDELEALGYLD